MGKPVLATTAATDGLDYEPGEGLLVADEAAGLVSLAIEYLGGSAVSGSRLRQMVCSRYSWENNLAGIERLLEGGAPDGNDQGDNQPATVHDKLSAPVVQ